MSRSPRSRARSVAGCSWRALGSSLLVAGLLLAAAPQVRAAGVTLEATPLLGGHARTGSWTAVQVRLRNDGPQVDGELRLVSGLQGRSTYGTRVDLPTNSDKRYTLYGQPALFRNELQVLLLSDGQELARQTVSITAHDTYQPVVAVVAEQPQRIIPEITAAYAAQQGGTPPAIVALTPADLPARVEAWSAIDRLVWQDVDTGGLDESQKAAMQSWLAAGGRLVVLGGSTGDTTLTGLGEDLLPYQPNGSVDVPPDDLSNMLGRLPAGAGPVPALTGPLARGTVLGRTGDAVIAAEATIGQGRVALIGFDPGIDWLARTPASVALWRRLLPTGSGAVVNPLSLPDDSGIVSALNNLPAVELPQVEQLFLLLLAYTILIGPINYLVLRRLDRREWAWLTIPLLVAVFGVASFALGRVLKGSDVIVNQIAIVRAGPGTDAGLGQVYVGVFSPSRQPFDVRVGNGALLSNPISQQGQQGGFEQPLDVLTGETTSELRNYQVGHGVLRGFRAESVVSAPYLTADLRFVEGRLTGVVRNGSSRPLEAAAIIFGGDVLLLQTLGPDEARPIDLRVTGRRFIGESLGDRVFGPYGGSPDTDKQRVTRRAVIDQLVGYNKFGEGAGMTTDAPLLIGWQPGATLGVELRDQRPRLLGESLYLVPLPVTVTGSAAFGDGMMRRTVLDSDAIDAGEAADGISLGRGTMTFEYRPLSFDGRFRVERLALSLAPGGASGMPDPRGAPLRPLPPAQQPDQDDPVGDGEPEPQGTLPSVQLFDRSAGRWVEFPRFGSTLDVGDRSGSHSIADPARYVDVSGSFLMRVVNRGESAYFQLLVGLTGTIE